MAGLQVPLGILPAGTANVLGMETGIGGNLVRAATRFQDLEPATISLGRMTAPGSRRGISPAWRVSGWMRGLCGW